jgi:hypothetical protein
VTRGLPSVFDISQYGDTTSALNMENKHWRTLAVTPDRNGVTPRVFVSVFNNGGVVWVRPCHLRFSCLAVYVA